MAYPTRAQVKQRVQSILDDYPQTITSVYTETVFAPGFEEAYDVMFAAFVNNQGAKIELMTSVELPPYTFEATPADLGIVNMAEPIFLREKLFGSSERFKEMVPVDVLAQRQPSTYLREWNWRNNTFYFIGATNIIDLEVKYEASSVAPIDDAALICVDSSLNFLANYTVGAIGGRKGDEATAARCMLMAVGPKYTQGTIGGQLFMLIQPSVRDRQNVQIAHRPYTTWGRPFSRWGVVPYVAAQQGTTGGGAQNVPIEFSSQFGGIIGAIDGVNLVFWVNAGNVVTMQLYRNGVLQSVGFDYTYTNNQITFSPKSVPVPGDILTAQVFVAVPSNFGSAIKIPCPPPTPSGGEALPTQYSTATGGVSGAVDGTNSVFTVNGVSGTLSMIVFVNGLEQTLNVDYAVSGATIMFLAGSIPVPGDTISVQLFQP